MSMGLDVIAEQGLVFAVLVVIIGALIWDRKRLLTDLKDLSDKFILALEKNGEKYADVVDRNTNAFTNLSTKIDNVRENPRRGAGH